jgi:hypothetical protein
MVTITERGHESDVLASLAALTDQNLLRRETQPDGEPYFQMLETIREYALERPCTCAVRRAGSTRIPFIRDRSMTSPSSTVPRSPPLWPPPRIAAVWPRSRAQLTAVMTSPTSAHLARLYPWSTTKR